MTFPYFEFDPHILRPIIPIIIKSTKKVAFYSVLIDSGADHCIFNLGTAKALGIKLKSKDKTIISGIGKGLIQGYWNELELRVAGKIYTTKVIFANISDYGYGILGQQGFFDHFDVTLSYHKKTIEIQPIRYPN